MLDPWQRTPLVESLPLSRVAGCRIFLKLENMQPSGSFKIRGIGHLMRTAIRRNKGRPLHFYCPSAGNAGLACATVAKMMSCEATIVVPASTSELLVKKLMGLGAEVVQTGENLAAADRHLKQHIIPLDPEGFYVPPFDHPLIWAGQESLLDEVQEQMADRGGFDAVICSVGGGSMLSGIQQSLLKREALTGQQPAKVLAVETRGADSLNASLLAGRHVTLDKITSIAKSLGVSRVAEQAYNLAQLPNVRSIVLSDADAAMGCVRFADDERVLIEAACGVSLAAVYNGSARKLLGANMGNEEWSQMKVVVSVCGGSDISPEKIKEYRETYGVES